LKSRAPGGKNSSRFSEYATTRSLSITKKWERTPEAEIAFHNLKRAFTKATILQHFVQAKQIVLQTNATGFGIGVIVNQYDGFGTLRPVNFYSPKWSSADQNYDTYDWELLGIVETMKHWRHYVEGANYKVLIHCNHKKLQNFQTSKEVSQRQAMWADFLSSDDLVIEHLEGSKNLTDGPARRPDYEIGYERPTARLLATLTASTEEPYDDVLPTIVAAQPTNSLAVDINEKIVNIPMFCIPDLLESSEQDRVTDPGDSRCSVIGGALTYEGRIYVPADNALGSKVISLFHDNPKSDHFGAVRTAGLVATSAKCILVTGSLPECLRGCGV